MRKPIMVAAFASSAPPAPPNNAPVVDLNGVAGGTDIAQTFTEGDGTLSLCLAATVTDADGDPLLSMTIVGADFTADDEIVKLGATPVEFPVDTNFTTTVTAGSTTFAVAFTTSNKTFSITKNGGGTAAASEWQSLLRTLAYVNDSIPVTPGDRTLSVTANDGAESSAVAVTLTVAASGGGGGVSAHTLRLSHIAAGRPYVVLLAPADADTDAARRLHLHTFSDPAA